MPQHKQVVCFGKQNSYCDMRRTEAAERLHGKWLCKAQGNTNNNNNFKKTGLVNSWITIEAHSTSIIRRRPSGWGFGSFPYIPLWHAVSWRLERLFMLSVRVLSTTKVVRMTHQTRKKDWMCICVCTDKVTIPLGWLVTLRSNVLLCCIFAARCYGAIAETLL